MKSELSLESTVDRLGECKNMYEKAEDRLTSSLKELHEMERTARNPEHASKRLYLIHLVYERQVAVAEARVEVSKVAKEYWAELRSDAWNDPHHQSTPEETQEYLSIWGSEF